MWSDATRGEMNHLGPSNKTSLLHHLMTPIVQCQGPPFIPGDVCQGAYSKQTIATIGRPGEC
jgi:hypothetical protein